MNKYVFNKNVNFPFQVLLEQSFSLEQSFTIWMASVYLISSVLPACQISLYQYHQNWMCSTRQEVLKNI